MEGKRHSTLLYSGFAVLIIVFLLNLVGGYLYLYWSISWYDSVVHFLAGVSLGLITLWILRDSGLVGKKVLSNKSAIVSTLIIVMAIGIGWEIFEYVNGLTQSTESYPLDTFHDLLADFSGSLLAGYWGVRKFFYHG